VQKVVAYLSSCKEYPELINNKTKTTTKGHLVAKEASCGILGPQRNIFWLFSMFILPDFLIVMECDQSYRKGSVLGPPRNKRCKMLNFRKFLLPDFP
jgi:hypothetical protein